jgi:signal transduction histidine kinase
MTSTARWRAWRAPGPGPEPPDTGRLQRRAAGREHERRTRRWLRQRPLAADALLALTLVPAQLLLWFGSPDYPGSSSVPLVIAFTVAEMAFVVIRRRWTWAAVVGLAIFDVVIVVSGQGGGGLAFIVLGYTAAAYLPLRPALAAVAVLWAPGWLLWVSGAGPPRDETQVPAWFLFTWVALLALACFVTGRLVRTRRAYVAALEERARTAEANQRSLAAQAVGDERRRIARELHDVVAHHVAVMGVLATGVRRAAAREPAAAGAALATIEETGRTVLREMRRLLDVLRSDTELAGELAPQPGLAGIEALVEQVREAGLPVTLIVEGEPGPLDAGVALSVYRLVQEALTNVLKHAGQATAQVRIGQDRACLYVEVVDTGRGPVPDPAGGAGHGLVSMRERVTVYGGTLWTGPRPGGGFRVYAKIPADRSLNRTELEPR